MTYNVLFGFKQAETEQKIVNTLRAAADEVVFTTRDTKESIKSYLRDHAECTAAIIREGMGAERFTVKDFEELTDTRDINIIAIIDKSHKGTEYIDNIYAAGILNGIFVDDKKGANPLFIAHLITNPRCRRDAKKYYGISDKISLNVLTYDTFVYYFTRLNNVNEGINIIDRYLSIVAELSAKQVADFTNKLPLQVRKELAKYEEFYLVMENLKKRGIKVNVTKPANVKRGLTDAQYTEALNRNLREGKVKRVKKEQPVKESISEEEVEKIVPTHESDGNLFFTGDFEEPVKKEVREVKEIRQQATREEPAPAAAKKGKKDKKKKEKREKLNIQWKYVLITLGIGLVLLGTWYMALSMLLTG